MATPTKAEQEAEGRSRLEQGVLPTENNAAALEGDTPLTAGADPALRNPPTPRAGEGDAPPPPLPTPRADSKRDEIVARFRNHRTEEVADQADEIAEFTRSGMPQEFQHPVPDLAPQDPPVGAEAEAGAEGALPEAGAEVAPQEPRRFRVKVHGAERELTEEELIAKAQIALASENILDEAKAIRDEVRAAVREGRNPVQRPDQPGHHAGEGDQHAERSSAVTPPPDQEDAMQRLLETIQFGDPAEAKELLQNTIGRAAAEAVDTTLRNQRLRDEGARSAKVLADFEDQHQDLAKDPMARAAIESKVLDKQIEDIRKLGVDPYKIPTQDGGPVTPAVIAEAHRWYRAEGFNVRKPEVLLQEAADEFLIWKGEPKKIDPPTPADDPPAPPQTRVEVRVNRDQRRQAIPTQPPRAAAPRQAPAQQAPQTRDRSAIVQEMAAKRGMPRGRAIG